MTWHILKRMIRANVFVLFATLSFLAILSTAQSADMFVRAAMSCSVIFNFMIIAHKELGAIQWNGQANMLPENRRYSTQAALIVIISGFLLVVLAWPTSIFNLELFYIIGIGVSACAAQIWWLKANRLLVGILSVITATGLVVTWSYLSNITFGYLFMCWVLIALLLCFWGLALRTSLAQATDFERRAYCGNWQSLLEGHSRSDNSSIASINWLNPMERLVAPLLNNPTSALVWNFSLKGTAGLLVVSLPIAGVIFYFSTHSAAVGTAQLLIIFYTLVIGGLFIPLISMSQYRLRKDLLQQLWHAHPLANGQCGFKKLLERSLWISTTISYLIIGGISAISFNLWFDLPMLLLFILTASLALTTVGIGFCYILEKPNSLAVNMYALFALLFLLALLSLVGFSAARVASDQTYPYLPAIIALAMAAIYCGLFRLRLYRQARDWMAV